MPFQRQRLQASAREADEVLLERVVAEDVGNLVFGDRAVRALGRDKEAAVALVEP